jgi:hypothetical protein
MSDDDLHEAVRAIYKDTTRRHRNTDEAFDQAVELVSARRSLSVEAARREVARMLAVEPSPSPNIPTFGPDKS